MTTPAHSDETSESERAEPERAILRLMLAAQDMAECKAASRFLAESSLPGDVCRALETAIPVAYARPWGSRNTIGGLGRQWRPPHNFMALHKELLVLRNKVYAHTDQEIEARGLVDVSSVLGERGPVFTVSWSPIRREALPQIEELATLQGQRFNRGALILQKALQT